MARCRRRAPPRCDRGAADAGTARTAIASRRRRDRGRDARHRGDVAARLGVPRRRPSGVGASSSRGAVGRTQATNLATRRQKRCIDFERGERSDGDARRRRRGEATRRLRYASGTSPRARCRPTRASRRGGAREGTRRKRPARLRSSSRG
eukprot:31338-Pelagococcus_subviridis.AAC.8